MFSLSKLNISVAEEEMRNAAFYFILLLASHMCIPVSSGLVNIFILLHKFWPYKQPHEELSAIT
jgi:hypothetical protein